MPEIAAAHRAAQGVGEVRRRRFDLIVAGGIALVTVAGLVAYPYANADETSRGSRAGERPVERTTVTVPALSTVRESTVSAQPLVEASPAAAAPAPFPTAATIISPAEGTRRPGARSSPAAAVPVAPPLPAREPVVARDGPSVDPPAPPPPAPPAPVDPWQTLRDALGACAQSSGLWERATCEQRARLAQCDGYWGNVAVCPGGRTEFGQ